MSVLPIPEYVNLVQMNVARTEHAYRQMRPIVDRYGDARLGDMLDAGLAASGRVADLAARRRSQSQSRSEDGDTEFDTLADAEASRLVKAIRETHTWMQRTRHSLRSRVRRLVMTHCPVGPGDIVSQRYEEQLHRTRALVADLRGEFADLIEVIECERKLQAVEATIAPYEEALAARVHVSAGDVRAAARVMHAHTAVIVAYVIGVYHTEPDRMEALLLSIADQQARIRVILKARRAGQSVGDDPSRDDDDALGLDAADGDLDDLDDLDEIDAPLDDVEADAEQADAEQADAEQADAEQADAEPEQRAPQGPLAGNPAVNLPVFTPIARGEDPNADG